MNNELIKYDFFIFIRSVSSVIFMGDLGGKKWIYFENQASILEYFMICFKSEKIKRERVDKQLPGSSIW